MYNNFIPQYTEVNSSFLVSSALIYVVFMLLVSTFGSWKLLRRKAYSQLHAI